MKTVAKLTIELLANGDVAITGPLQNKAMCYSLLEMGRDEIFRYHEKRIAEHERRVQPATAQDIAHLNGAKAP